jgi:hypothetical protein
MTPVPYRRWRRGTLLVLAALDLGIFAWHLWSRSALLRDASDFACLVLIIVLACCDGRGLWNLCGRMRKPWPAVVGLLALWFLPWFPLYLLLYLGCAWWDHRRGRLLFYRCDLRTRQGRQCFPLSVYDNITLARHQLAQDQLLIWQADAGKWEVEWPAILYVQVPRAMPDRPGETHLRFLLHPYSLTGYVVVLHEFAAGDQLVVLDVFSRMV